MSLTLSLPPLPPILKVKLTTPRGVRNFEYAVFAGDSTMMWKGESVDGCDITVDDARILYNGREEHLWSGTIATSANDIEFKKTGGNLVVKVVLHRTKVKDVSFEVKSHPFITEYQQAHEAYKLAKAQADEEDREAESRKRAREETELFWARAKECVDMIEAIANGPAKRLMAEKERGCDGSYMSASSQEFDKILDGIMELHKRFA